MRVMFFLVCGIITCAVVAVTSQVIVLTWLIYHAIFG